jgi:hypothetical protein
MLKQVLILLVLTLTQWGCDVNYGENLYPFGDLETKGGSFRVGAREAGASEDRKSPSWPMEPLFIKAPMLLTLDSTVSCPAILVIVSC